MSISSVVIVVMKVFFGHVDNENNSNSSATGSRSLSNSCPSDGREADCPVLFNDLSPKRTIVGQIRVISVENPYEWNHFSLTFAQNLGKLSLWFNQASVSGGVFQACIFVSMFEKSLSNSLYPTFRTPSAQNQIISERVLR